jgi:hypothetical protein
VAAQSADELDSTDQVNGKKSLEEGRLRRL